MDDNATCHRTLAVQDCLDSEGIQRLVWPARSPDLNRIENVWDALGRQVAGRNYPPTNKNTLIRALPEEWDKLPQQLLDNVVQSMTQYNKYTHGLLKKPSSTPSLAEDENDEPPPKLRDMTCIPHQAAHNNEARHRPEMGGIGIIVVGAGMKVLGLNNCTMYILKGVFVLYKAGCITCDTSRLASINLK
ncbi:DDE_3 domain-containing protein [Trichonephila clavipes]|nr:DDE_3 domain-containing protein [Trichonephila clavipes]